MKRTHSETSMGSMVGRRRRRQPRSLSPHPHHHRRNRGSFSLRRSNSRSRLPIQRMERTLWTGRMAFLLCLIAGCATLGSVNHRLLHQTERENARRVFALQSMRVGQAVQDAFSAAEKAARTMARILAEQQSQQEAAWPLVALPGYERIARELVREGIMDATPPITELDYAPLVSWEQYPAWKEFAQAYYSNFSHWNEQQVKSILDQQEDEMFISQQSTPSWTAPIFQVPVIDSSSDDLPQRLFLDLYRTENETIETAINCAAQRQQSSAWQDTNAASCAKFTTFSSQQQARSRLVHPIYSLLRNDPNQPVRPAVS